VTDQLSDTRTHHHSPDPLRNHGYNDVCSCGVRIHRDADGTWAPDNPSTDATCKTCPWWEQYHESQVQAKWNVEHNKGDCRRHAPIPSPDDGVSWWPFTDGDAWCGEHPGRQPHLEYATTTLFATPGTTPTESDMRRIIDALEKMASRVARAQS